MLYSQFTNWANDSKYIVVSDPLLTGHVTHQKYS